MDDTCVRSVRTTVGMVGTVGMDETCVTIRMMVGMVGMDETCVTTVTDGRDGRDGRDG